MKLTLKRKTLLLVSTLLIFSLFVTGCSTSGKIPDGAVAMVNGSEVSTDEFDKILALHRFGAEAELGVEFLNRDVGSGMTLLDTIKRDIQERLIIHELLVQQAKKSNIIVTTEEIENDYALYSEYQDKDAEFVIFAEANGIDEDFIKGQIEKELLIMKYQDYYLANIDEAAARAFYEENPNFYNTERVSAKHILVDEDQLELAEELIVRYNAGESFEELARTYSTDTFSGIRGGDLGYVARGETVAPFEEALFSLEIGEISKPVQSEFGYHIILVEDKVDIGFEGIQDELINYLKRVEYEKHLEDLLENAEISRKEKL